MDAKEIKKELMRYNEYLFNIDNYKLELKEKEIKFKEATDPIIGGFSSEPNSYIRAKYKKSNSMDNQVYKNINKEAYYKKEVKYIKSKIAEYELKSARVLSLINLIDKESNRDLIKKRYIYGVSIYKLADDLCIDSKSIYKRIDEIITKLAIRTKSGKKVEKR